MLSTARIRSKPELLLVQDLGKKIELIPDLIDFDAFYTESFEVLK